MTFHAFPVTLATVLPPFASKATVSVLPSAIATCTCFPWGAVAVAFTRIKISPAARPDRLPSVISPEVSAIQLVPPSALYSIVSLTPFNVPSFLPLIVSFPTDTEGISGRPAMANSVSSLSDVLSVPFLEIRIVLPNQSSRMAIQPCSSADKVSPSTT